MSTTDIVANLTGTPHISCLVNVIPNPNVMWNENNKQKVKAWDSFYIPWTHLRFKTKVCITDINVNNQWSITNSHRSYTFSEREISW